MAKEERNGHLTSSTFGGVQITHNNPRTEIIITLEFQALLDYLVLQHDRIHLREILADMFSQAQNQENACKCLNIALWKWKWKKALEAETRETPSYGTSIHHSIILFNDLLIPNQSSDLSVIHALNRTTTEDVVNIIQEECICWLLSNSK